MKKIFKYVSAAFVGGFIVSAAMGAQGDASLMKGKILQGSAENRGFRYNGTDLTISEEMGKQYPGLADACRFMNGYKGEKPISFPKDVEMLALGSAFRELFPVLCFCNDVLSGVLSFDEVASSDREGFCHRFYKGIRALRKGGEWGTEETVCCGLAVRVLRHSFPKESVLSMFEKNVIVKADCAAHESVTDLLDSGLVGELNYQVTEKCGSKKYGSEDLNQVLALMGGVSTFNLKTERDATWEGLDWPALVDTQKLEVTCGVLTEAAAAGIGQLLERGKVTEVVFDNLKFADDKACEVLCCSIGRSKVTTFRFQGKRITLEQQRRICCSQSREVQDVDLSLGDDVDENVRMICSCLYSHPTIINATFGVDRSFGDKEVYEREVAMAVAHHPCLQKLVLRKEYARGEEMLCQTVIDAGEADNKNKAAMKLMNPEEDASAKYAELLGGVEFMTKEEGGTGFKVSLKLGNSKVAGEIYDNLPKEKKSNGQTPSQTTSHNEEVLESDDEN